MSHTPAPALIRDACLFGILNGADLAAYGLSPATRHGDRFDEEVLIEVHRAPDGTVKHIVQPLPMFGPTRVRFNHLSLNHSAYTDGLPIAETWQLRQSRLSNKVEFLVDGNFVNYPKLTEHQRRFRSAWRLLHQHGDYRAHLNRACTVLNALPQFWLIEELAQRLYDHLLELESETGDAAILKFAIVIANSDAVKSSGRGKSYWSDRNATMTSDTLMLRLPESLSNKQPVDLIVEHLDTRRFLEDLVNMAARRLLPIALDRTAIRFHRDIADGDRLDRLDDLLRKVTIAPLTPLGRD